MRWRILFVLSLGANIALACLWHVTSHRAEHSQKPIAAAQPETVIKTNVVLRKQYFSWDEIESTDYPTYVANLRDIGCPEQTIRDIIIADVNALYARRRATEITSAEQQWWRSEPDPAVVQQAAEKLRAIEAERRALLTKLLGTNWEGGDLASLPRPSREGVVLDGPVLGVLPAATKQAIESLSVRAQDRLQTYLDAMKAQGKNPDPGEIARLREETRQELAGILTPPQLEEYLLRYSQNANDLRSEFGQLKYFEASPEEFRAIFRATDQIDQKLELLGDATDANSVAQRKALVQQRLAAIKTALGPDRYRQYVLLHDPAYQQAFQDAQKAGTPDAVGTLYAINLAAAQQQGAVTNSDLTPTQQEIEQKRAELEKLQASALATGQELPPTPEETPAYTNAAPTLPPIHTHPYVLGAGETAATVATLYGVSIDVIQAANPDLNIRNVRPGDVLRVPDSLQGH